MKEILRRALSGLNPRQREAAEITDGPLLIVAGAGSGKTRTLTVRIAFLIEEYGIPPEAILAVTFTNKAAGQMRDRLRELVPEDAGRVTMTTFHSFCCQLLRRWADRLGYPHTFTIYDDEDQERLIKKIVGDAGLDKKEFSPRMVLGEISQAKNELIQPEHFSSSHAEAPQLRKLYERYQKELRQNGAMDFDDLIFQSFYLLNDHPDLLKKVQGRYTYFLVDEYQDTNTAQYRLISILSMATRNLCVVGDEDQSIYGWRGASIRNILEFDKDFPGARVVVLDQNYRSTQPILQAAGAVIANNNRIREKNLWTDKAGGELLNLHVADDDRGEAEFVVEEICRRQREGDKFGDFAVLFRMNHLSRLIEQSLVRRRIPYEMTGGTKFFGRREVKDILAYVRIMANPDDSVALSRIINVPRRGIGDTTVKRLEAEGPLWKTISQNPKGKIADFVRLINNLRQRSQEGSLSDLFREILDRTQYLDYLQESDPETAEDRQGNVKSLLSDIRSQEQTNPDLTIDGYLEQVALHSDLDDLEEGSERVHLLTMHNAKGLEFPVVFVMGAEEGVFPHHSSRDLPQELEEERRLAYVAITRAMKHLYLTAARRRMIFGSWTYQSISRFVTEIPQDLFRGNSRSGIRANARRVTVSGASRFSAPRGNPPVSSASARISYAEQSVPPGSPASMVNLQPGVRVHHELFGEGNVVSTEGTSLNDFRVVVFFKAKGRKNFLLQYTKLRVINSQNQ
jgi:DNA helicase-2/ATP-dependent DNA helicase PcrA